MVPRGLSKDWKRLAERMREVGFLFEDERRVKAFAPDGRVIITLQKTPSARRALQEARALFQRWCKANGIEPGV